MSDHLDLSTFNISSLDVRSSPSDGSDPKSLTKRALTFNYILATITLDGRNQGNQVPFVVTGQLLITSGIPSSGTRNGKNPVEVLINIGNPYANPKAGNLRYSTNRYLWPYFSGRREVSRVDFAYVSSTSSTVKVTVDGALAAANQLSVFNTRTGITANVYQPSSGGFNLVLGANGRVSGKVEFQGRGMISGGRGTYRAVMSGRVTNRGRTTL
ncbi:hypothetical protein QBC37DRAFT_325391 [Rhypophila decipiens]|uniref:Uncharacterized protein n=1 Tax=Rhypophila decipiens TaxID=261697 RepID=A0AAN6XXT3_9PEZI|nr:hypothetical protein QBC37DRAFT_325391 [Rhypophila decipiens]